MNGGDPQFEWHQAGFTYTLIQMIPRKHHSFSAHFMYFACLEDDLLELSRWIEFAETNNKCYSTQLARLLMMASAEVDVVARILCEILHGSHIKNNIHNYQALLQNAVPMLPDATVDLPQFGLTLQPWASWATPQTPPNWWQGYNKVKHERDKHFCEANLINVLESVAGLLVLLLLLSNKDGAYFPLQLRLFEPKTFAIRDSGGLRIAIPDGATMPWERS